MKNKISSSEIIPGSPVHKEAQALSLSVAAIRKAQGKTNPADFPVDSSPAWHRACLEFANDVLTVLIGPPDENMPDDFIAFELGYESEEAYRQALKEDRLQEELRKKTRGDAF